ncbi:hypothetical protein IFR05_002086 [Cadophora sp. M221]|nr:hypothetical protein IFR05_002086 [Cadophora sp. M221]
MGVNLSHHPSRSRNPSRNLAEAPASSPSKLSGSLGASVVEWGCPEHWGDVRVTANWYVGFRDARRCSASHSSYTTPTNTSGSYTTRMFLKLAHQEPKKVTQEFWLKDAQWLGSIPPDSCSDPVFASA